VRADGEPDTRLRYDALMTNKWAKYGFAVIAVILAVTVLATWYFGSQVPKTLGGPPFCAGLEGQVPDCPATPAP
jgi:hypothetical protein